MINKQQILWTMPEGTKLLVGYRLFRGNTFVGYEWNNKNYSKYCQAWAQC